jgi:low affinity Fe/Cu permease
MARKKQKTDKGFFTAFAEKAAKYTGHPAAFLLAFTTIIVWGVSGPVFGFSDTWQLVINTGTTIITFLMVFLIQNSQNRDTEAMQLKLDELIRCTKGAHTVLLDLEKLSEKELDAIRDKYQEIAHQARKKIHSGEKDNDMDVPDIDLTEILEEN